MNRYDVDIAYFSHLKLEWMLMCDLAALESHRTIPQSSHLNISVTLSAAAVSKSAEPLQDLV